MFYNVETKWMQFSTNEITVFLAIDQSQAWKRAPPSAQENNFMIELCTWKIAFCLCIKPSEKC